MMKMDVLDELDKINICTAYRYKGNTYKNFPMDFEIISGAQPVYEEMPGWKVSLGGARRYNQLPVNARRYIERLERLLKVKIKYISVGSRRDEIIVR